MPPKHISNRGTDSQSALFCSQLKIAFGDFQYIKSDGTQKGKKKTRKNKTNWRKIASEQKISNASINMEIYIQAEHRYTVLSSKKNYQQTHVDKMQCTGMRAKWQPTNRKKNYQVKAANENQTKERKIIIQVEI